MKPQIIKNMKLKWKRSFGIRELILKHFPIMKTKLAAICLMLSALFIGCNTPKYLPKSTEIGINQYGSFIRVEMKNNQYITEGELIAIDTAELVILSDAYDEAGKYLVQTKS